MFWEYKNETKERERKSEEENLRIWKQKAKIKEHWKHSNEREERNKKKEKEGGKEGFSGTKFSCDFSLEKVLFSLSFSCDSCFAGLKEHHSPKVIETAIEVKCIL